MIETSSTLRKSETLNQRIYEEFAQITGRDPSMVRGKGVVRQFVPPGNKGSILNRPPRGSRPLWTYKHVQPGRGPLAFILPIIFNKRTTLQLARRLLSNDNYSVVKQVVAIYSYFKYVKFVTKVGRRFIPRVGKFVKNKAIILCKKLNLKRKFKIRKYCIKK